VEKGQRLDVDPVQPVLREPPAHPDAKETDDPPDHRHREEPYPNEPEGAEDEGEESRLRIKLVQIDEGDALRLSLKPKENVQQLGVQRGHELC